MERGRAGTPSWFWPTFAIGTAFAGLLVLSSAIAGVWLMGVRARDAARSSPVHAYAPPPPRVPIGPFPSPIAPAIPPNAAPPAFGEPYGGEVAIEVIVADAHGRAGVGAGDRCTLSLAFSGDPSGDGTCSGTLACEGRDRPLWSAGTDQAFACTVQPDAGTILASDRPGDGRPSLTIAMRGGETSVTVSGGGRRGRFVVVAASE